MAKGAELMKTKVAKWGNSQGVRLPKFLLEIAEMTENDTVEVTADSNGIMIKKSENKRVRKSTAERIAGYTGDYVGEEWDTGPPVGDEVW
jgi:antitoxin MazE